jgi:hypothetical protein
MDFSCKVCGVGRKFISPLAAAFLSRKIRPKQSRNEVINPAGK